MNNSKKLKLSGDSRWLQKVALKFSNRKFTQDVCQEVGGPCTPAQAVILTKCCEWNHKEKQWGVANDKIPDTPT